MKNIGLIGVAKSSGSAQKLECVNKHNRLSTSSPILVISKRIIVTWLLKLSRSIWLPLTSWQIIFSKETFLDEIKPIFKSLCEFLKKKTLYKIGLSLYLFPNQWKHHNSNSKCTRVRKQYYSIYYEVLSSFLVWNEFQDKIHSY